MAVSIDVALKLDDAERELNEFQTEFVNQIKKATEDSEELFNRFSNHSEEDLRKLALAAKRESEKIAAAQKQAAKEAVEAQEKVAKEIKETQEKWAQGAENFRGFVGDVGDAVGQLGKGLLGLTEEQQLVADKFIYMGEKGMAMGAAIGMLVGGPLGALAGSVIGGVGGGILGLVAGNAEVATEKLERQAEIAGESAKTNRELSYAIRDLNKELGNIDTTTLTGAIKSYDAVQKQIDTIDKKLEEITAQRDKYSAKVKAGAKVTEELRSEQQQLLITENDLEQQRKKLVAQQEITTQNLKARAKEEASVTANSQAQLKDLTKDQLVAAVASRKAAFEIAKLKQDIAGKGLQDQKNTEDTANLSKKIAENAKEVALAKKEYEDANKALKTFGKTAEAEGKKAATAAVKALEVTRDHAETMMDDGRDTPEDIASEDMQRQLDVIAFMAKVANDEIANIRAHNRDKEAAEEQFQHNIQMLKQEGFLKLIEQQERQRAEEAQQIEAYAATVNNAINGVGQMFATQIGGVATDAFNDWLETIATGEKDAEKSFKKTASALVRSIGEQLVADGIKNIFMGTGNLLTGQPAGGALIALGGGEIAAGIGMGAVGARAQRRQGYGSDKDSTTTSNTTSLGRSANNTGTQVAAPSIINLGMLALTDQRQMEMAGRQIAQAQAAYSQGRR